MEQSFSEQENNQKNIKTDVFDDNYKEQEVNTVEIPLGSTAEDMALQREI